MPYDCIKLKLVAGSGLLVYRDLYVIHLREIESFLKEYIFLWNTDLADVSNLQKYNPDNKYLLIAIVTFSRYLSVVPLINKSSKSVIAGFKQIFSKGKKPKVVTS